MNEAVRTPLRPRTVRDPVIGRTCSGLQRTRLRPDVHIAGRLRIAVHNLEALSYYSIRDLHHCLLASRSR